MTTNTRQGGGRRFIYFFSTALGCYISDCGNCGRRRFEDDEESAAMHAELHTNCFDFSFI